MASWNKLINQLDEIPSTEQLRSSWLRTSQQKSLERISEKRNGRNVIFYASGFLQKPAAPAYALQLTLEEINGFMAVMYQMNWSKGLTLILHTPGGVSNAVETVVDYVTQKFSYVEVIIPAIAMSAGTMISLAADKIIMGHQSQLGPIDPQMPFRGTVISARAILDQFEQARKDISADVKMANLWAPVLTSIGPGLLQEAKNALDYGQQLVAVWLSRRMCSGRSDPLAEGARIAEFFNKAQEHKSHGRRINRDEARSHGVDVEDLETDQEFQDAVLTAYHVATLAFEKGPAAKFLVSNNNLMWVSCPVVRGT